MSSERRSATSRRRVTRAWWARKVGQNERLRQPAPAAAGRPPVVCGRGSGSDGQTRDVRAPMERQPSPSSLALVQNEYSWTVNEEEAETARQAFRYGACMYEEDESPPPTKSAKLSGDGRRGGGDGKGGSSFCAAFALAADEIVASSRTTAKVTMETDGRHSGAKARNASRGVGGSADASDPMADGSATTDRRQAIVAAAPAERRRSGKRGDYGEQRRRLEQSIWERFAQFKRQLSSQASDLAAVSEGLRELERSLVRRASSNTERADSAEDPVGDSLSSLPLLSAASQFHEK